MTLGAGAGRSAGVDSRSGLGLSVTMDGASCGKISRLKGKISVDLNPDTMFLGVITERKVSCTISGMA